jgi:antirestriction protein ArdC
MAAKKTKSEMLNDYKQKVDAHLLSVAARVIDAIEEEVRTKKREIWESDVITTQYHNPESGTEYNFENSALLFMESKGKKYSDKRFVTAKQAFDNGLSMEKGTKGTYIVQRFAMPICPVFKKKNGEVIKDGKGKPIPERDEKGKIKYIYKRASKLATVFNVEQLVGELPARWNKKAITRSILENEDTLSDFLKLLEDVSPAPINRHQKDANYYSPIKDTIYVSDSNMFKDTLREVDTIMHEMAHSTGHEDRLNRDSLRDYSKDISIRGYEEIVANFSARTLGLKYGLSPDSQKESFYKNHDAYDASWGKACLKKDPLAIFRAMEDSGKACKFMERLIDAKLESYPSLSDLHNENVESAEAKVKRQEEYDAKQKDKPKTKYKRKG